MLPKCVGSLTDVGGDDVVVVVVVSPLSEVDPSSVVGFMAEVNDGNKRGSFREIEGCIGVLDRLLFKRGFCSDASADMVMMMIQGGRTLRYPAWDLNLTDDF